MTQDEAMRLLQDAQRRQNALNILHDGITRCVHAFADTPGGVRHLIDIRDRMLAMGEQVRADIDMATAALRVRHLRAV